MAYGYAFDSRRDMTLVQQPLAHGAHADYSDPDSLWFLGIHEFPPPYAKGMTPYAVVPAKLVPAKAGSGNPYNTLSFP